MLVVGFFLTDRLEDSDFGPVSQAILAKREAKLRELIGLDYDLGEQDRFGWTPLHLSVYWPFGMKILLAAGVQHNGRLLNSGPSTPLEYAIANRQNESILLLLGTDSVSQICPSVLAYLLSYHDELSSRTVTATIGIMVQRSNRLRSLAITNFNPCVLDRLCISHEDEPIQILDAYATPTVNALKDAGVEVPEILEPHWVNATVYHSCCHISPELADRLWSSGFHDIDVYDERGYTPLHHACLYPKLDMASWLMFHGGDPTTVIRGHSQNAFHLLACGLKDWISGNEEYDLITKHLDIVSRTRLDIVSRIAGLCGTSCQHDCRCACSPDGCTPASVLLRVATLKWCEKEDLFSSWCQSAGLSPNAIEICCLEFARVETFERLGITHVCCKINYGSLWVISDPMPQDTIEEIQDEESEMIDQLESWMILYEEERAKFQGPAIEFLGKWSDMLRDELDVPAPFEENWSRRVKTGESKCMPDYFTKPSLGELA